MGTRAMVETEKGLHCTGKRILIKVKNLKPKERYDLQMARLHFNRVTPQAEHETMPLISEQPIISTEQPSVKTNVVRKLRKKTIVHRKVFGSKTSKENYIKGKTVKTKKLGMCQKLKAEPEESSFITTRKKETLFIQPVRCEAGSSGYKKPKVEKFEIEKTDQKTEV